MRPTIALDETVFRENALAWRSFAGVPIRAVIKADAYNWSYEAAVRALAGVVDAFCVSDADEFFEVRKCTNTSVIILGSVPIEELAQVLAEDGVPTIEDQTSLAQCLHLSRHCEKPLRIRLGITQAIGFSGIDISALPAFADELRGSALEVELWTHITDQTVLNQQLRLFTQAGQILNEAGVKVAGTDVSSTLSLALGVRLGTTVRIGIGLFGATFGQYVPGIRCAICVKAPIVHCTQSRSDRRVGYGGGFAPDSGYVLIARCGYSDGLPLALAGSSDILSVGMQYMTLHSGQCRQGDIVVLDRTTSLDQFAARANQSPHEVVTTFGNARRAQGL